MLEIRDLTKRYGDVLALDGATFTVVPGRIVGFLGPPCRSGWSWSRSTEWSSWPDGSMPARCYGSAPGCA